LTYLERQKSYVLDKKILFKKPLFDLEVKGQGHMKVMAALRGDISFRYLKHFRYLKQFFLVNF
jgi:hypothetical protein